MLIRFGSAVAFPMYISPIVGEGIIAQGIGRWKGASDELRHRAEELQKLLDARATARANREWAESDRLRGALADRGILVEDTRDGQRWRRAD